MNQWLRKRFSRILTASLLLSDIFSLLLSIGGSYILRFRTEVFESISDKMERLEPRRIMPGQLGGPITAETVYLITAAILVLLWLFLFTYHGLYREKRSADRIDNWLNVAKAISIGTLLFLVTSFFIRSFTYSRVVIVLFWATNIFLTVIGRITIRKIEARYRSQGYDKRNVIILGISHIGDILHRDMTSIPSLGYEFLGWIDDVPRELLIPLGRLEEIPEFARKFGPLDVFIVDPHLDRNRIMTIIAECDRLPVRFKIVSGLFEVLTNKNMERISGFPILEFGEGRFTRVQEKIKRLFDIVMACITFILVSPLFVLIPLLIKIKVGGPVFFTQQRIGKGGIPFTIYKFCSMSPSTNPYAPAPSTLHDERITPVGRFIRKTSLDELPQLLNVLNGSMSLVGPRPEMPFLVEKQNQWERQRMSVKPGMTGFWQTMGRSDLPLQEHLEFDLYYIRNQSIFFDIQILLRTILVVVFGKGAY